MQNTQTLSDFPKLLGSIAGISGDRVHAFAKISDLLKPIEGFLGIETSRDPEVGLLSFVAPIGDSGESVVVDADPTNGLSQIDWHSLAAVVAATLDRCSRDVSLATAQLSSSVIVKDRDGRFLHVNESFAELYGSSPTEMIGKSDYDFGIDKATCDKFLADDRKAIDSGESVFIPHERNENTSDRKAAHFETIKIPLKNAEGCFDRVLIVANPIEEDRRVDVGLGIQNSFLLQLLDNSPNWIVVKDREGRIVFANQTICGVFGKEKSEVIGKNDSELNPNAGEVAQFVRDDCEVFEKRERKIILEEKLTGFDGRAHWVQTVKKPIIEPDGSCNKILIVSMPIGEQRAAAAKLRESERFLRDVIDSNPSVIIVKDAEGRFVLVNQTMAELYGGTTDEVEGCFDADFNSDKEEVETFRQADRAVIESGESTVIDCEKVTDSDGTPHWFQTIKKPIQNEHGETQVLVVASNITRQIEIRKKLKKTKEKAERASEAKTEFLTRMSHELRTPLNAILGFNQLLQQDDNLTGTQIETLDIVNKSGKHLLNLINEILEMSKIELGEMTVTPVRTNLVKLFSSIVNLFEARAQANDCLLTLSIDSEVPKHVSVDEMKLRQVVMNLISNAVKFTNDGYVKVSIIKGENNNLRVVVTDNGAGISQEEANKVFGMFKQTESGQKSEEGAGLGLSISQRLIQAMGGEISFESEEGVGSEFTFEIPVKEDIGEKKSSKKTSKEPDDHSGNGLTVLVVDDAPANRIFVSRLLDKLGYRIFEAENGLEAVEAHLTNKPDIILMDVKMPLMDGMTATATIRNNEAVHEMKRVPIIALTANAFDEHRRRALQVGCDDFITKPFEFNDLVAAISEQVQTEA